MPAHPLEPLFAEEIAAAAACIRAQAGLDPNSFFETITLDEPNRAERAAFNESGRQSFSFSNHDVPRSATRQLGALGLDASQCQAMQLLLLKLETSMIGSTCVYQGEELGLEDVRDIPVDQMQDPWGIEFAPIFLGRDTCRTPMVWRASQPDQQDEP